MDLRQKAHELPARPGVYFLKDKKGSILYIGKAKRLNKRVISYFLPSTPQSTKNQRMLFFVSDFDYQLTDTELEALLLEQELIARLHPPYNRLMNFSGRYVYLTFDGLLTITQEPQAASVGPFTMYKQMPDLIRIINDLYDLANPQHYSAATWQLRQKRVAALPTLTIEEKTQEIHALLKGGTEGLDRLQLLQKLAVDHQAFEWAQSLQIDKEILLHFKQQTTLLTTMLEPKPQLIWDAVDEERVKVFQVFQGKILSSKILPKNVLFEDYWTMFDALKLPPKKSFIPLKEIDRGYIIARYLKKKT